MSEQAYIPNIPTLLNNAAHNKWQCHAFVMGSQSENHHQILVIINKFGGSLSKHI